MGKPTRTIAIVGRGPAGLSVALAIRDRLPATTSIVSIDPHEGWLDDWTHRLAVQDSAHLRSPSFHHPSLAVPLLDQWARDEGFSDYSYDTYYRMPSVVMFNDFCSHLRERELGEVDARTGVVRSVDAGPGGCVVTTDHDEVHADIVVLAGSPMQASLPDFVDDPAELEPGRYAHSLDVDVRHDVAPGDRVVVVGGGHTAAALSLAAHGAGADVTMLVRRPLRHQRFDAPPGWLSHRGYQRFRQIAEPGDRAAFMGLPHGTVPPAHARRIEACQQSDSFRVVTATVDSVERSAFEPTFDLLLEDGSTIRADRVWLATGRAPDLAALPTGLPPIDAFDGFPALGRGCRWGDAPIFAAGVLARLQIGMTAANLHGQRLAARSIAATLAA